MSNSSLKGKTLLITGASRGIGRAIALRAAKDGANIVILAKTDKANDKLPGTIHSVAAEVVKAGGQALPCKVDLRNPSEVEAAVKEAVEKFGGIDIVVNNASALAILPTLETDIKRFDLVNQINSRGTWLTSRLCLPHLLKSSNPHILTLSPPLDMDPKWFKPHCGYTMAKYGMSMVTLGLSAEFKEQGVGVNALWPLTTISTDALNILGGDPLKSLSRTDSIMADAAYIILTQPARQCTGNFFIDEDLLRAEGVTDFSKYSVTPGATQFAADFFVPATHRERFVSPSYAAKYAKFAAKSNETPLLTALHTSASEASSSSASPSSHTDFIHTSPTAGTEIAKDNAAALQNAHRDRNDSNNALEALGQLLQDHLQSRARPRSATRFIVQYEIQESPRTPTSVFTVDLSHKEPSLNPGKISHNADCVIGATADDLLAILQGRLDARDAFSSGRLIVRGNLHVAMTLHGSSFRSKL
jgi:citronellol/citronellal dehydrogenase